MNKHTPGPWKVTQKNFFAPFRISADSYSDIAEVSNEHDDETKANAHLISFAPEMYEAIEKFVNARKDWIFYRDEWDNDGEELAGQCLDEAQKELEALFKRMNGGCHE